MRSLHVTARRAGRSLDRVLVRGIFLVKILFIHLLQTLGTATTISAEGGLGVFGGCKPIRVQLPRCPRNTSKEQPVRNFLIIFESDSNCLPAAGSATHYRRMRVAQLKSSSAKTTTQAFEQDPRQSRKIRPSGLAGPPETENELFGSGFPSMLSSRQRS